MSIALEDFHEDIIGKAARGLGIGKTELAERSGVNIESITSLLDGKVNETTIRSIAPVLALDPEKLVISALKQWRPRVRSVPGLFQANTPYHDMLVNAFLLWDEKSNKAAVFDTGTNIGPILEQICKQKLTIEGIFLTHTHGDHIACLEELKQKTGNPQVFVHALEAIEDANLIEEGFNQNLGNLKLRTLHTHGHSQGGMTYVIEGLEKPIAVVGDAMFAGSMGGGMVSYADALQTNREKIMTLTDETILCPGHGPMTTVDEEKRHNPFFPEF